MYSLDQVVCNQIKATRSFKQILSSGNYLYDVIADVVNDICTEFPEVYSSSVRRELASIIFPELKANGWWCNPL